MSRSCLAALAMIGALACASRPAAVDGRAPGNDAERFAPALPGSSWRAEARAFEATLDEDPTLAERLQLARLHERAGDRSRASAAWESARSVMRTRGLGLRAVALQQTYIDRALWADDTVVLIRRTEPFDYEDIGVDLLEVWSLLDGRAPLWREYTPSTYDWLAGRGRVVYASRQDGLVRFDLATHASATVDPGARHLLVDDADDSRTVVRAIEGGIEIASAGHSQQLAIEGTTRTIGLAYNRSWSGCREFVHESPTAARTVRRSSDGRFVAVVGDDERIRLFDMAVDRFVTVALPTKLHGPLGYDDQRVLAASFVGDTAELRVAFAGGDIVTWRAGDGEITGYVRGTCEPHERRAWLRGHIWERGRSRVEQARACAVAKQAELSPDGQLLATAGDALRIRDADTGASRRYAAGLVAYDELAFDRDGRLFHAPNGDGEDAGWWSSASGWQPLFETHDRFAPPTPRLFADRLDIALGIFGDEVMRWDLAARAGRIRRALLRNPSAAHVHVRIGGRVEVVEDPSASRLEVRRTDAAHTLLATVDALPAGGYLATSPTGAIDGTANALAHVVFVVDGSDTPLAIPPHAPWRDLHAPGSSPPRSTDAWLRRACPGPERVRGRSRPRTRS